MTTPDRDHITHSGIRDREPAAVANEALAEVVPGLVEFEVAVPRSMPAVR